VEVFRIPDEAGIPSISLLGACSTGIVAWLELERTSERTWEADSAPCDAFDNPYELLSICARVPEASSSLVSEALQAKARQRGAKAVHVRLEKVDESVLLAGLNLFCTFSARSKVR